MTFNALETFYSYLSFFGGTRWKKRKKRGRKHPWRRATRNFSYKPLVRLSEQRRASSLWKPAGWKGLADFWRFSKCLFQFFKQLPLKALLCLHNSRWKGSSPKEAGDGHRLPRVVLAAAASVAQGAAGGEQGGKEPAGHEGRSDRLEKHTGLRNGERAGGWKNSQTLILGGFSFFSKFSYKEEWTERVHWVWSLTFYSWVLLF